MEMKYISALIVVLALWPAINWGQQVKHNQEFKTQRMDVSDIKVTHLIFGEKITYLDIGSRYFIADTIGSMAKIKHTGEALSESISKESNLTVVTENGDYYSILLHYNRNPSLLTHRMYKDEASPSPLKTKAQKKQEALKLLNTFCGSISSMPSMPKITSKKDDIRLKVTGLFYHNNYLAIRLTIENQATIHLDFARILLRLKLNKKFSADYVYQERIIEPRYVCNDITRVEGGRQETITLIFDKFTPNDKEKLFIDVSEINGGRSCSVDIPRKKLLTPKQL